MNEVGKCSMVTGNINNLEVCGHELYLCKAIQLQRCRKTVGRELNLVRTRFGQNE